MVIQTVAARAVAGRDRAAAAEALRSVERCGREALTDLRQMIGVLHHVVSEVLGAAPPELAQIERLAERARTAGLPVDVRVEGESRPLSAGLDLVSYRLVQEALTDAIKHAGQAHAQVLVIFARNCLELEIVDTGRGSAPGQNASAPAGHGLMGMQERVALYGGQLHAGSGRGGGFTVHATSRCSVRNGHDSHVPTPLAGRGLVGSVAGRRVPDRLPVFHLLPTASSICLRWVISFVATIGVALAARRKAPLASASVAMAGVVILALSLSHLSDINSPQLVLVVAPFRLRHTRRDSVPLRA